MKWISSLLLVKIIDFLARNLGDFSWVCCGLVHSGWFISEVELTHLQWNVQDQTWTKPFLVCTVHGSVKILEPKLLDVFPYAKFYYSSSSRIENLMQWNLVLNPNESIITLWFLFWISLFIKIFLLAYCVTCLRELLS